MKERPIIFSGPMVRAILEGRKTQTRRVVKPQPPFLPQDVYFDKKGLIRWRATGENIHRVGGKPCPYGQPGDRLWVRETFGKIHYEGVDEHPTYFYRADETDTEADALIKWRPSIHMPRWASRITLEVVSVRVERLRDITGSDALAEGIPAWSVVYADGRQELDEGNMVDEFRALWESINGPGSWDANPWVWVVEFKRL